MFKQQLANLLCAFTLAFSYGLRSSPALNKNCENINLHQQKGKGTGDHVARPIRKTFPGTSSSGKEGSIIRPKKSVQEEFLIKDSVIITDDQDAIICGTLLGDGHIQKRNNSYRLKIAHTETQKPYVDWLYEKLKSFCTTTAGVTKREQTRNGKINTVYEFFTSSNQDLKKYHDLFYQKQVKIVNDTEVISYKKTITPELISYLPKHNYTLATFYLDDGSARTDFYGARFATQGFSKDECHLLQDYFHNTWDLNTSVVLHNREKSQYSLSVPAKVFPKFIDIVEKTIHEIPEMEFKLNEKNKSNSKFK